MKELTFSVLAITLFLLFSLILRFIFRNRLSTEVRLLEIQALSENAETGLDLSAFTGNKEDYSRLFKLPVLGKSLFAIQELLTQARILWKPTEFLLISLIVSIIGFLLMYALTGILPFALLIGALSFFLPRVYVSSVKDRRARKLNNQLPEFLNILSNGLRAGLSFNQAIASFSNEMEDPIQWELKKVLRDNTLGRSMEDALNDMVTRTRDDDIEMFVTAINIQLQVGGNLSEVLDMIAETIRARVKLKGEVRTLTSQSRLSALIIGILPLAVGVAISVINPQYLSPLFNQLIGQVMVGTAIVMTLIGAFLLKKIATIEV